MAAMHAVILLLLFCSACSYQFRGRARYGPLVRNPDREWERMEKVISDKMTEDFVPSTKFLRAASSESATPKAKNVPEYLVVPSSKDHREAFKPEKGARPLPDSVKEILLQTATTTVASLTTARPAFAEVLCHVDRMYVRVRRDIFKSADAYKSLTLGTCPVNQGTRMHYYFLYLLKNDCGFNIENKADIQMISNRIRYQPTSVVLREMPFDIPVRCNFPRLFHSYAVGFYPDLKGGSVLKALTPKSSFTLTTQDASGNEITGVKTYTLGQPMYFEAKKPEQAASGGMRIYINKCFMTASKDPTATPKYTVIDNQGCMIDGKIAEQSKFITGTSKMTQKFSIGALVFKDKVSTGTMQQLYMHCDISMGALTPTPSSKACNYDSATKKWKELYDDDYVCTCCDTTCAASPRSTRNMISTHSWKVDLSRRDKSEEVHPRMTFLDEDTFSLEDPSMAEHKDFLKHWDHDY